MTRNQRHRRKLVARQTAVAVTVFTFATFVLAAAGTGFLDDGGREDLGPVVIAFAAWLLAAAVAVVMVGNAARFAFSESMRATRPMPRRRAEQSPADLPPPSPDAHVDDDLVPDHWLDDWATDAAAAASSEAR